MGSSCLLGRRSTCDLRVEHPRVSGEHASVHWMGDRWELRDLGSRNGTYLDGRRLSSGERARLPEGVVFTLGGTEEEFALADGSSPRAVARNPASGAVREAAGGLLVLPDDQQPLVSIFESSAEGGWVAESRDGAQPIADQTILVVGEQGWLVELPNTAVETWTAGQVELALETCALRFGVSRDEEHVELTVVHEERSIPVPPRSHHYLLLTLARAYLNDAGATPTARGWIDRESVCRMLATDVNKLNVDIHRARRQLGELGIQGAASIVVRRPATGQLRIGVPRVEVNTL
ncbi:hypothetical protein SOCE26_004850 [Sorangium cellulosum]|uniref:FHA domain-containing protein n=2 Tax=Sorangium cellulosum TaxID=56 RepID=A0A2L0EIH2_SORCE|nr:FHA domain-containing protein [Sorangium cellulosum]AUX39103.1 hypothetical protein SOCE26_004850 [Sorangium cellulosum]